MSHCLPACVVDASMVDAWCTISKVVTRRPFSIVLVDLDNVYALVRFNLLNQDPCHS